MNIQFKSLILTAVMASTAMAFTACDDDKDMPEAFGLSDGTINIEYDGLDKSGDRPMVEVNATGSWAMTKADEWLTLSQTSGEHGSYNLFVEAQENRTGKDRRGFIQLNMGSKVHMLTVNQTRKTIQLTLSSTGTSVNAIGLDQEGTAPTLNINANEVWTLTLPEGCDWIQTSTDHGDAGDTPVTFTVSPNTTGETRTATIAVTSVDTTRKYTITQDWNAFTTDLSGDPTNIILGALGNDASLSMTLGCLEAWEVTEKPEWLTITPDHGNAGETPVTLSAPDNNGLGREGNVTIKTTSGIILSITLGQRGTAVPFDSKAVGYAYFQDDMAWAVGGQDQVGSVNGSAGTTRNIYSWDFQGNGFPDVKAEFDKRYTDMNEAGKTVYAADGYLKFGMGSKQTAFMIKPALDIETGCKANVEVSFKAAKNGTDKIMLAVAIQGDGEIVDALNEEKTFSQLCDPINNSDKNINWQWKEFKVTIKGATSNTRIVIGESQFIIDGFKTRSGYFRGFIDDIAVKRIAND